jgi:hypothetical protein
MTNEDLEQHAAAWEFAARIFWDYEDKWRGSSLQGEATSHRRLCDAIAQGYRQQIKDDSPLDQS